MKTFGNLLLVVALFAALAFGLLRFSASSRKGGAPGGADAPLPVETALAARGTLEITVEAVGRLFARHEATLSAQVEGRLASIALDPGDRFAEGDPLAEVDRLEFEIKARQAEIDWRSTLVKLGNGEFLAAGTTSIEAVSMVRKARANVENLRLSRDRVAQLRRADAGTRQSLDDVSSRLEMAEADLQAAREEAKNLLLTLEARRLAADLAKKKLADATVRAPFPCAVVRRLASAGEWVKAGTPLAQVVATDPIRFRGLLPEDDARHVRVGSPAAVRIDAAGGTVEARVSRMSPSASPDSHSVEIECDLPNPDGILKPGFYASALVGVESRPAVFVPIEAVEGLGRLARVFEIVGGASRERAVEVARRDASRVALAAGLEGGETVAVTNVSRLRDGAPVAPDAAASVPAAAPPAASVPAAAPPAASVPAAAPGKR